MKINSSVGQRLRVGSGVLPSRAPSYRETGPIPQRGERALVADLTRVPQAGKGRGPVGAAAEGALETCAEGPEGS